jgi:hypothetical protein
MDKTKRQQIYDFIKDNDKVHESKSIRVIHRESARFGDEYLMVTIIKPEQYGYYKDVHITFWKKPWVKTGAFHFVSGLDRAPSWKIDAYGFFKVWFQVFDNNGSFSIRKYIGKDVKQNIKPPKDNNDPKYKKYREGLDKIRERYFIVVKYLIEKGIDNHN